MFAEKLDAAHARDCDQTYVTPLAGPFPNLRARETVKAVVCGIVETVNHCRMTEADQTAFVLGFLRGAITLLRQECEEVEVQYSALPHLLDILDKFNERGIIVIRTLAGNVAGQELREAVAIQQRQELLDCMLPPLDRAPARACVHCGSPHHAEHPRELPEAAE